MMLPIRSMAELSPDLKAAVLKELGGWDPEDNDSEPVLWNDPSTWKPVGAAAEREKANTRDPPEK